MLPDWIAVVAPSASTSALRILLCVARSGTPAANSRGARVIAAQLSYENLQRRSGLSRTSIARGIRDARRKDWLVRLGQGSYAIPTALESTRNGLSGPGPITPLQAPDSTRGPAFPDLPAAGAESPQYGPVRGEGKGVGEGNAEAGPGTVPDAGFYGNSLAGWDQAAYLKARDVEGLDGEIALLRTRLRQVAASDPARLDVCLKAASTIARLLRARRHITDTKAESLKKGLEKVWTEIAGPVGLTREQFLGRPKGLPGA